MNAIKQLAETTLSLIDYLQNVSENKERDYQTLLIELDKAGIRKLNRNSPELLKHFPEYKQSKL